MNPEFFTPKNNSENLEIQNTTEQGEVLAYGDSQETLIGAQHETYSTQPIEERYRVNPAPVAMPNDGMLNDNGTVIYDNNVNSSLNPVSANDDDNIEREWVNRAKQILEKTKSDPRARERAIAALKRDYLFKRYGKQLGETVD